MKKKIVIAWVLAIAFVFCAVPAFAQQKLVKLSAKTLEREFFNIPDWGGTAQEYTPKGAKMRWSVGGMNALIFDNYLETGNDGYIYIYGVNNNNLWESGKIFIKVGANSRVEVSKNKKGNKLVLTLTKGSWQEDKGAKELAKFESTINFVNCVNASTGTKIEQQVAEWKRSGTRTNDQHAEYVIRMKAARTGFYGAIAGFGGAFSIGNQFIAVLADWVVQAEMAYAIACVYLPKPPTEADFQKDLYMLLCDEEDIYEAMKSEKINIPSEITNIVVMEIAENVMQKIMKKIAEKQTNRFAKKAATAGTKGIPVLSSFIDGAANFAGATAFGDKAKRYYSNAAANIAPSGGQVPTLDKLTFTLYNNKNAYSVKASNINITGAVVIPATHNGLPVTTIGTFRSKNITSISIPASVEEILTSSFSGATSLASVTFLGTSTKIASNSGLTGGADLIKKYNTGKAGTYTRQGETWTKQGTTGTATTGSDSGGNQVQEATSGNLKFTLNSKKTEYSVKSENNTLRGAVIIPASYDGLPVTTINSYAFQSCKSITSVSIPASVATISGSAFSSISNITRVTFLGGSTKLADSAFPSGANLNEKYKATGAGTYIKQGDFWSKQGGTAIGPSGANAQQATMDKLTFSLVNTSKNNAITVKPVNKQISGAVIIPAAYDGKPVTAISSFSGCTGITSVSFPASVETMGSYAFQSCNNITSVTFLGSTTKIGSSSAFPSGANLIEKYKATGAGTYIKQGQFWNKQGAGSNAQNTQLVFSLIKSNTAISVKPVNKQISGAVVIPSTYDGKPVTTLISFGSCKSITSITIPASVASIGVYAFSGCNNITSVTFLGGSTKLTNSSFPKGTDLNKKYSAGGAGTYTRAAGGDTWTKR